MVGYAAQKPTLKVMQGSTASMLTMGVTKKAQK